MRQKIEKNYGGLTKSDLKDLENLARELDAEPKNLTFDSMAQAASATKIPLRILKSAKRNGCPAFKSNRVFLPEFLEWYFAKAAPDAIDFTAEKARLTRAQAVAVERENKIRDGQTCEWDDVLKLLNERFYSPLIAAMDAAPDEVSRDWVENVLKVAVRVKLQTAPKNQVNQ